MNCWSPLSLAVLSSFDWQRQMRFSRAPGEKGAVEVDIGVASLAYGWAYHGNAERMVITALTDRCFLALTTALHFGMGGAPAGVHKRGEDADAVRARSQPGPTRAYAELLGGDGDALPQSLPHRHMSGGCMGLL